MTDTTTPPPNMTLAEFQASKVWHDNLSEVQGIDFCEGSPGYTYAGTSLYIEKLTEGEYSGQFDLVLSNNEWVTPNLAELEERLYRYAVDEQFVADPVEAERLKTAVDKAEDAFWESIADDYPECKTGDLDPWTCHKLSEVTLAAARSWVRWNRSDDPLTHPDILAHQLRIVQHTQAAFWSSLRELEQHCGYPLNSSHDYRELNVNDLHLAKE